MLLHISAIKKIASRKWNLYNQSAFCSVEALVFVIVNEAVSSGLYAAVPRLAAQGNTND